MKVKISQTIDVTDEQRAAIGAALGKKQASRDECREFIWRHGSDWDQLISRSEEYQHEGAGAAFMGSALGIDEPDDLIGDNDTEEVLLFPVSSKSVSAEDLI